MPAGSSEPEKYSIDEMMNRLTASPSDDPTHGERVTRSDGSQAIRVRKRKRRSAQPHKERAERNRKVRIVQVSAAFVLLLLAGLATGAAVVYANSKPFRESLVTRISTTTGAEPELETFRMNPRTANSGKLTLRWPQGNVLDTLGLRQLTAEIFPASFLGKAFTGEEITVADATLTLRLPEIGEPLRAIPAQDGQLPIRFKRYRTPNFTLTMAGSEGNLLQLIRSEASFSQESVGGNPQLRLYHGDLGIPGWPKLRVDRGLIEFRDGQIDILGLRIMHESEDSGSLTLSGSLSPYQPDHLSSLAVSLESFQLSGLIGSQFGNLISGRVDSAPTAKSNSFSFKPVADSVPVLEAAFSVSPLSAIEVRSFPFLASLSRLLDEDDWFEKPIFDSDATGVFHRENGNVALRDLNLQSKGRMTLRGDLSVKANQALSGNLRIGLPESMVPRSSPLKSVLSPPQDGTQWVSVKISGTSAVPADNFDQLFENPASPADDTSEPTPGSSFEDLTRPHR
jgi:hypothetical protein